MKPSNLRLSALALATLAAAPALHAASTSWVAAPADANWATGANWAVGTAPGTAAGSYTNASRNADVATFNQAIGGSGFGGASAPVVTDTNRFLLGLTFGTGAGSYVIGSSAGNLLQLDRAGSILMQAGVTVPQVIANPIQVRQTSSTNATYTFQNDSTTASAILSFTAPAFTLTCANGRPSTLTLAGSNTGNNIISSNITDTMAAQGVGIITKTGAGRWILSGANTFTITSPFTNGGFQVNGGTLSIQNNLALGSAASAANGNQASINSTGTLELANGITLLDGIILNLNNGGTLSTVGSTTSNATLRLPTVGSGVVGTIATTASGDVLTLGNAANDITGGLSDTVLNVSGPGTVSLPFASNYAGNWSVNGGTLLLGSANSLGPVTAGLGFGASSAGTVKLNGFSPTVASLATNATVGTPSVQNGAATDATLTVSGTVSSTFGGALVNGTGGGKLALAKAGSSTLTLSGTSTLTGGTTVSGSGTLLVTGTLPGAVSAASGTTLGGTGTLSGAVSVAAGATVSPGTGTGSVGTLTAGSLTLAAGSGLTAEFGTGVNDKVVVTGSGGLTLDGGAVALLDAATQLAYKTNGSYQLFQYSGALGGGGTGALVVANPQSGKTYEFGSTGSAVTITIGDAAVNANWNRDGNGSWNDSANWQNDVLANGVGEAANFTLALTAPRTVTLDGDVTSGGLTFGAAQAYTIAQGTSGTLTLDNGGSQANFIVTSGSHAVSAPVVLASNTIVSSLASTSLALSGSVSGPGSLTKSSAGSLTLSGSNSYTGGTSVSGGTLAFDSLSNLGSGNLAVAGGTLLFNTGNTADITARVVTVGTGGLVLDTNGNNLTFANTLGNNGLGGLVKNGGGILTLGGVNTYNGPTALNAGALVINSNDSLGVPAAAAGLSLADGTTLRSTATLTLAGRPVSTGAASVTFSPDLGTTLSASGTLSGSGLITVANGTLSLDGDNSLSRFGSYLVTGTLALGGGTANTQKGIGNGVGTITFDGGTLAMNSDAGTDTGTLPNPLVVAAGKTGTLKAAYRGRVSGALTGSGIFNVVVAPYVRSNFNGDWSAFTGQINITTSTGAGGEFRISDFQVNVFTNAKVNLGPNVSLRQVFNPPSGTGTVTNQPVGELSGDPTSYLGGNPVGGRFVNWQIGGLGTNSTFAGTIVDDAGATRITKVGNGILTLSGASTFTGGATVSAGTVKLGSPSALGSGPVTVNVGTLDLNGQAASNTATLAAGTLLTGSGSLGAATLGGSVTPGGAANGLLTLASATVTSTSAITFQLTDAGTRGSDYDALTVSTPLALDGTITVVFNGLIPAAGQSFDLIDSTGAIDVTNFATATDLILPTLVEGLLWDTSAFATDGVVSIISANPYTSWQTANFTAEERGNPLVSGVNADPDGDGLSNALEYAFGTIPKTANSGSFLPQSATTGSTFSLSYLRPSGGGVAGVTYTVQTANANELGGTWNDAASGTDYTASSVDAGGGFERVTVTFTAPVGPTEKRFGRIFVSY